MPKMWYGSIYVPMWASEEQKKKVKKRGKKPGFIRGVQVRSWIRTCDCGEYQSYERKPTPYRSICPACHKRTFVRQLEDYI